MAFVDIKCLKSLIIEGEEMIATEAAIESNEIYQKIFEQIEKNLPNDWKKVIVYIAYTEGSYSVKYYVKDKADIYTDCFKQVKNKAQLINLFLKINKIIESSCKTPRQWSVMTMIINSNGHMKTDYSYEDISDNMIAYEKEWKKKYLV